MVDVAKAAKGVRRASSKALLAGPAIGPSLSTDDSATPHTL